MTNCKNCGSNEFKDGKCSYCGTDYGLTGDRIQDEWLISNKRKATMEADGWEIVKILTPESMYYKMSKGEDWISAHSYNYNEAIACLWEDYCYKKYKPEIKEVTI